MCILWKSDDFQIEHTQTTSASRGCKNLEINTNVCMCSTFRLLYIRLSLFSGTGQNGMDQNSTLKHGTDQEIPRHVTATSSLYIACPVAVGVQLAFLMNVKSQSKVCCVQPNYQTLHFDFSRVCSKTTSTRLYLLLIFCSSVYVCISVI